MEVILQYSRSYISGIRKTFISYNNIVTIAPLGVDHKLLLKSTKKGVKPLEIILDDSELADLTRCLDLLRFDNRFNISWNIKLDKPFRKRYIISNLRKSTRNLNLFYSLIIFSLFSGFLLLIPINNNLELRDPNDFSEVYIEDNKY